MRMPPILIFIVCIFFHQQVVAQRITPSTQNNGGGYAKTLEWSIGETISIDYFSADKVKLNTGVLQPLSTVVTSVNEYGPAVFGNQIVIGPNPTLGILHLKAAFTSYGNLKIQLLDAKSQLVSSQDLGTLSQVYNKDISLEQVPSGVYYLKVFFKPMNANNKTGIFKIIKL